MSGLPRLFQPKNKEQLLSLPARPQPTRPWSPLSSFLGLAPVLLTNGPWWSGTMLWCSKLWDTSVTCCASVCQESSRARSCSAPQGCLTVPVLSYLEQVRVVFLAPENDISKGSSFAQPSTSCPSPFPPLSTAGVQLVWQ